VQDDPASRAPFLRGLSPELLTLKPINLEEHSETCVTFRIDSFVQSFGSAEKLLGTDHKGAERYLDWLRDKMRARPGSCCHAWYDGQIIGQIELGSDSRNPSVGWVNLVYVAPSWRRRGLGSYLLGKSEAILGVWGFERAGLRVSRTNDPAIRLYSRCGWSFLSNDPESEGTMVFAKTLGEMSGI
jgi:GNAT superfamily N-acetyltransferase